jgi:hypothetical protein
MNKMTVGVLVLDFALYYDPVMVVLNEVVK